MSLTFEDEIALAKGQFETWKPGGDVLNIARLTTPNGEVIIGIEVPTAEMRSAVICQAVEDFKATRCVTVGDAWMTVKQVGDDISVRPAFDPERIEVLIVTMVTADEAYQAAFPYIVWEGRVEWGENVFGDADAASEEIVVATHLDIQQVIRRVRTEMN